nr:hypothetical protein [uncultured Allomuricauda sp.]
MNEEEIYFEDSFFKDLRDRVDTKENPLNVEHFINEIYGRSVSGPTKKFLEFHSHFTYKKFGQFYPTKLSFPDFQYENLYKSLLADSQIGLIQAFTESISIGNDASGQFYLLGLGGEKSPVYRFSSGSFVINFLSNSIESFAYLNCIFSDWIEFEKAHEIDEEAIIDGNIPNDLDVSSFRQRLAKLSGKVNLSDPNEDFLTDYDELFTAILGENLKAVDCDNVVINFNRAEWIIRLLNNQLGETNGIELPPVSKKNQSFKGLGDILYWLWRHFFRKEDDELRNLLGKCSTHKARIITDTISLITALLDDEKSFQEFNYIRLQRELLHGRKGHEGYAKIFDASFLDTDDSENQQIKSTKEQIKISPKKANYWDDLAYCYYATQEWNDVLYCSKMSLALKPDSYYAWMQQGIALWQLKRYEEALKAFDYGLCYDGNENLWLNKAFLFLEINDSINAIAHLQQLPSNKRANLIKAHKEFDILKSEAKYQTLFKT